jgi:hypothetical protein
MLQIPEAAQWLPQNTPALLEARGPLMQPEVARELGLTQTQVVEAVARARGERMELFLNGRTIEVPPGWRMSPGQTVWLTGHSTAQGLWVLRQHQSQAIAERALAAANRAAASAPPASANAPAAASTPTPGPAELAAAAAQSRVARAKVVLQARADGQDPRLILAKQTPVAEATPGPAKPSAQAAAAMAAARGGAPLAMPSTPPPPGVAAQAQPMGLGPQASAPRPALSVPTPPLGQAATALPSVLSAGAAPAAAVLGLTLPTSTRAAPGAPPSLPTTPAVTPGAAAPLAPAASALIPLSAPNGGEQASPAQVRAAAAEMAASQWSSMAALAKEGQVSAIDWRMASPRVRELAAHPPGLQAVMQLFQPQVLAMLMQSPGLAQWAESLARGRLSMRKPDEAGVKQALDAAMRPMEARLAQGSAPQAPNSQAMDLRAQLADLLRLLKPEGGSHVHAARAALNDVEAAQLDAVRAMQQREWQFQCVLPFSDALPAQVHIERESASTFEAAALPAKWWVNLYTEGERLGRVWMRSGIAPGDAVEMHIWATAEHVVRDARARVDDLSDLLDEAGLELTQFQVIHGERPDTAKRQPPPQGSVFDTQA